MTNREFAFNYAGKELMFYGDRIILVGLYITKNIARWLKH